MFNVIMISSSGFLPMVGVIGAVVTGGLLMFCGFFKKNPSNYPPGKYGIPLLGVLPMTRKHIQKKVKIWSLQHFSPIFYIKLGSYYEVSFNTIESIHEVFLDNETITSGRPEYTIFNKDFGISFLDDSDFFRTQKKFGKEFFKSLMTCGKMDEVINDEGERFVESIANVSGEIDLSNVTYVLSGNVLTRILFSKRFDYGDDSSFLSLIKNRYGNQFKKIAAIAVMPWLHHVSLFSRPFEESNNRKHVLEEKINEIIKEHEDNFKEDKLTDFTDHFIKEQRSGENSKERGFTIRQLQAYIGDILGAGITNVSTSLLWMVLVALTFPKMHNKLVEEIDLVLGKKKTIVWKDRFLLPYTQAFMSEVWRFVSPLQKTVSHKTNSEIKIRHFIIPANSRVYGNLWGAHHDPDTWSEPNKFNPKRFLNENGEYEDSSNLVPFGVGPRSCLAKHLARAQVFIMFVKILQRFTVQGTGLLPSITEGVEAVTYDPLPYKVVVRKR